MWYDWMVGGWGARNGRDGWAASGPVFGVQLGTQPFEGQERLGLEGLAAQIAPEAEGRGLCRDQ